MKTWLRWLLPLLVLVIAYVFGTRLWQARKAAAPAAAAAAAAAASAAPLAALPTLELAPQDLLTVQRQPLTRGLDVSGSLKAVNSAFVKARLAAELKTLDVREGDSVRVGQVLGQLDATEFDWRLRQADQQALAAKAQLEIAQRQLTNNKALVAQGFISPTALETSVSSEAGAQATLQAALAAVELARKSRADTVLTAPIAGMVSQRLAQPGERVAVDARILEIVDPSRLELEAAIAPQDLADLRVGARASLAVDGSNDFMPASVVRINPSAMAGSRSVTAYLAVAGNPSLRNGLFARGRIALDQRVVLTLPLSAVRSDQAQPYAIRINTGRAEQRVLTLGARGQTGGVDMVEIVQGLAEGDRVLAASAGLVPNGVRLKLPAAPTAPAAPASAGAAG
jgi:RND family efflux transporter MFP subunit